MLFRCESGFSVFVRFSVFFFFFAFVFILVS